MSEGLRMWTVYQPGLPPYPLNYQAWEVEVTEAGAARTGEHMLAPGLDLIRGEMERRGLSCIARSDDDDPTIVESWL